MTFVFYLWVIPIVCNKYIIKITNVHKIKLVFSTFDSRLHLNWDCSVRNASENIQELSPRVAEQSAITYINGLSSRRDLLFLLERSHSMDVIDEIARCMVHTSLAVHFATRMTHARSRRRDGGTKEAAGSLLSRSLEKCNVCQNSVSWLRTGVAL